MAASKQRSGSRWGQHSQKIFLLQGGGALGAYQAGVYAGLAEIGEAPDWIAGVSIGGINAALIAGNPPERRVARLRAFWERVSSNSPALLPASFDIMRPMFNRASATSALLLGIPGFFRPRFPPPAMVQDGTPGALSYYDTAPLKTTLEELVDFDLINRKNVRLSLGAVNVRTGKSIYFDNARNRIRAEHVMASGALPPGFPPVEIDGEIYWDGGIVSNTPLWYIHDEDPRIDALIFQVDLFNPSSPAPQNLSQVQERQKDIQYSSKARFNMDHLRDMEELRGSLHRLLAKLPKSALSDPDVKRLSAISTRGAITLVQFVNKHDTRSLDFKDYEFSRATMLDLWQGGQDDVRRAVADASGHVAKEVTKGIRIFDLTASGE
ncbi:NTE family protein [Pseudoxanthomonas sp. 3HH-4]|uniref:patatin-like phospholipase family protein n=1 Tax=Pseudoxanthomonas sp. 3HH-4 TaxID=1690214 RepID=UPI0011517348|nr:patatin-like phospholipase family protein [Pseudoxanthomonas sp. 3HH-4]TQM12102.1 NTE family protein [Pseudoxanthomonas sp. 3HH-4]